MDRELRTTSSSSDQLGMCKHGTGLCTDIADLQAVIASHESAREPREQGFGPAKQGHRRTEQEDQSIYSGSCDQDNTRHLFYDHNCGRYYVFSPRHFCICESTLLSMTSDLSLTRVVSLQHGILWVRGWPSRRFEGHLDLSRYRSTSDHHSLCYLVRLGHVEACEDLRRKQLLIIKYDMS